MQAIWSARRKFTTWRRLWLALAQCQRELGLDISETQLDEMRAHLDDVDFERAAEHERRLRHDVMAHIHAWGEQCPAARPIMHLGATSQFVGCNTELLQLRDALTLIAGKTAAVVDRLASFAAKWRDLATLGFTHYQPAQPTTVGKRAILWAYDFALALEEIEHRLATLRFRSVKGTTGTQASFLALFEGDHDKVLELERRVAAKFGFTPGQVYAVTGQTYPRVVDAQVIASLGVVAAAVSKMCNDVRLLASRKEVEEPFEAEQIGSSAMAYKRNPMRCERATGLARFVISMAANPFMTASTQWFERTLDDSANRRLALPEPFLALDGCLDLCVNITSGLVVYPATIRANLDAELPFMASENLLMAAVKGGADRQAVHEMIRRHSQDAAARVKQEGASNDLLARLSGEAALANLDLDAALDPVHYIGRAPQQVDAFIADVATPIRERYADHLADDPELRV